MYLPSLYLSPDNRARGLSTHMAAIVNNDTEHKVSSFTCESTKIPLFVNQGHPISGNERLTDNTKPFFLFFFFFFFFFFFLTPPLLSCRGLFGSVFRSRPRKKLGYEVNFLSTASGTVEQCSSSVQYLPHLHRDTSHWSIVLINQADSEVKLELRDLLWALKLRLFSLNCYRRVGGCNQIDRKANRAKSLY